MEAIKRLNLEDVYRNKSKLLDGLSLADISKIVVVVQVTLVSTHKLGSTSKLNRYDNHTKSFVQLTRTREA